jgi:dihydroflavonol-4-reductase
MDITLVTGATGLVGYNIVAALLQRRRKVRALVRSLEKGRRRLPADCELVQGDVTDRDSVERALAGCTVVYHAAGFPEQWMKHPAIFDQVNVGGTRNMLAAALQQNIRRFVYTSTIDVFSAAAGQEYDESLLASYPKGTPYERSKQAADQAVTAALENGLPAVFLHPAGLYGPGPSDSPGTNDFILKLHRGQVPMLLPGGFPLVFAPDVGEGHVLAELKSEVGGRYILSEDYYALPDLARVILEELGLRKRVPPVMPMGIVKAVAAIGEWWAGITGKPPLIPKGQLHFMQWQAFPKNNKARQVLGWSPTPLRSGLQQTIAYLLPKSA